MIPEIKSVTSPDVNLESFRPLSPDFEVFIELSIGPVGSEASEQFYVTVCSPSWLQKKTEHEGCLLGRGYLIQNDFNIELVKERIGRFCRHLSGETWAELEKKLLVLGRSEFEGYIPP
jgi:hypothetical protein